MALAEVPMAIANVPIPVGGKMVGAYKLAEYVTGKFPEKAEAPGFSFSSRALALGVWGLTPQRLKGWGFITT